ncbi:SGNH hydrolase-type esterase domain-containing protein [Xylaria bambusicola]|uniref:SGNH hydrolase-type esterase domain-containing protein n=1 Tax=Xylaria bambusicola TaxID=326684 RepID=UPI0020074090|nr:SGNH hydrolase-type esterase domain-containing protein [Xylaria bambusicola]KAI0521843.1 SGNH hydrolase-type esterase domain-containing protein [Xylaria bambusicola]
MASNLMNWPKFFTILATAVTPGLASPYQNGLGESARLVRRDTFEWTALGDSYSSGVGSGDYISNSYRCLRYDHAYPVVMNGDSRLPGDHVFNSVVCSGSKTSDVDSYQFYDENTSGTPNWQYGDRPKFGNPSIATLSVGGNDIDFPGIIFNCILDTKLPDGSPQRTCDEQRKVTWDKLVDPGLIDNIDNTIKKIVDKARGGPIKDQFRLYVTGFPQFFDTQTNECDSVTFARTANPTPDGKEHTKLTQALRKEFNDMSVQLNKAIEAAVARNQAMGAKWIPIDGEMDGHRFCEPGVQEPDQHNPNLWLFHYPYNEPKDASVDAMLQAASDEVSNGVDINTAFQTYNDYQNALFDALQVDNSTVTGIQDPLWRSIGSRVKVFHPQPALHDKIRDLVLDAYVSDSNNQPPPPPPPPVEMTTCHGISGDVWVMSRDAAVASAQEFCQQTQQTVTYNKDSVNEVEFSVANQKDSSQGPMDAPDCFDRFQKTVIDGCDGNDPINNPHNYKFGGTFTSGDWTYTMTPLSKQVNEVSCDVSYKFFFDGFEIRGKNLPDATFGANGEGLKSQLSDCGSLTNYHFEWTPSDPNFQWYAAGRLPIGTKSCVGTALQEAGGSSNGNCKGAGKRRALFRARSIGIEDWPGYGDEERHVFGSLAAT